MRTRSPGRTGLRLVLCAVALSMGAGSVSSCSLLEEKKDPADTGLQSTLQGLDGVRDASVESVEVDDGQFDDLVTVDAEPEATADEIAAMLEAVAADPPQDPDPGSYAYTGVVLLDAGETEWPGTPGIGTDEGDDSVDGIWFSADDLSRYAEGSGAGTTTERFVSAVEAFNGARVTQDRETLVVEERTDADSLDRLDEASRTVVDDPVLAAEAPISLIVQGPESRSVLTGVEGITSDLRADWSAVRAGLQRLSGISVSNVDVATGGTDLAAEVLTIDIDLQLPGAVPPARLTPARYGDQLWPMIRAELDLLRDRPDQSLLSVTNTAEDGGASDPFLYVETGRPAVKDDQGRSWNAEALDYLGS